MTPCWLQFTAAMKVQKLLQCGSQRPFERPRLAFQKRPEFAAWTEALFTRLGPYPAGYLIDTPKQTTRQLKCQCLTCGYLARVTNKWLTIAGPPICPTDRIVMTVTLGGAPQVVAEGVEVSSLAL